MSASSLACEDIPLEASVSSNECQNFRRLINPCLDDSRARKVFGYKHRLSTLKLIKLTVQQVGANLARKKGATELPSGHTAGTVPLSEKAE